MVVGRWQVSMWQVQAKVVAGVSVHLWQRERQEELSLNSHQVVVVVAGVGGSGMEWAGLIGIME